MAPLPKRRHSSNRQAQRTRALKQTKVSLVTCPQCGAKKEQHRVCPSCGFYAGVAVVIKKEKKKRT